MIVLITTVRMERRVGLTVLTVIALPRGRGCWWWMLLTSTQEIGRQFSHRLTRCFHLPGEDLLSSAVPRHHLGIVFEMSTDLLLVATDVSNSREQQIQTLHHLLPMMITLAFVLLHRIQHEAGLNGWFGRRRGCSHRKPIRIGGNYGRDLAAMCKQSQAIPTDPVI